MTIAAQLLAIDNARHAIVNSLRNRGSSIAADAGLVDVPGALQHFPVQALPADYPDLSVGFVLGQVWGTVKVSPDSYDNWVTLRGTAGGGLTIDWGDGSAPEWTATSTDISHQYAWANAGPTLSDGGRACVLKVTSVNPITSMDLSKRPAAWAADEGHPSIWLDLRIDVPSCNSFSFGSTGNTTITQSNLRRVALLRNAITSLSGMFSMCSSLVEVTDFTATSATSGLSIFNQCRSLSKLPASMNFGNITALTNLFSGCSALVQAPSITCLPTATSSSMFANTLAMTKLPTTVTGLTKAFAVTFAPISSGELNRFFGVLPTVTGSPLITLTGVAGYAAANKTIATGKGWTVSG